MTMLMYLFFWIFITKVISDSNVTLQTRMGYITGISSSVNINNVTKGYTVFKKIPYAKPPIGDLRFGEPVAHGPWNGTLDATHFGPSCIQVPFPDKDKYLPNTEQSEDCLLLNIYTPSDAKHITNKSVMIWIHGGGYSVGQGMFFDGSYLSVIGDVIVVTINYRLNVFGFFSTTDDVAPGNYGLWDQKLAIQWVHDNIDSFGGDPNSVTIFGESAGGFSVGLHALNPSNKGLFHRIIAQSGVSNSPFATSYNPRFAAQTLAQVLNCNSKLTADTLKCMRRKTSTEIITAFVVMETGRSSSLDLHLHNLIDFAPVVDGKLLTDTPKNIITDQMSPGVVFYKSLDVIIGNCESEGSLLLYSVQAMQQYLNFNVTEGISSDFFCKHILLPFATDYYNETAIVPTICHKYSNKGSLKEQGQKVIDFYGDFYFYGPTVLSLNVHAINDKNTNQFQYMSKRRSIFSPSSKTYPWFTEAGHTSELPFLFPITSEFPATISKDKSFATAMMTYWSNFAKTGDVNGLGVKEWPEYDIRTKEYALLDVNVTIQSDLYEDRVDFWLTKSFLQKTSQKPCTSLECTFG